jgi:hypothetical protein
LHDEVLTDRQREGLEVLKAQGLLSRFYLVGGTAAALHLGHRLSLDFDFFTEESVDPEELVRTLGGGPELEVRRQAKDTLHTVLAGVPMTFLHYPYPLLEPLVDGPAGLRVVQPEDIVPMKLVAISQRGTRKDFIDLYSLCHAGWSLSQGLELLTKKYAGVRFERYHILTSLTFFADADKQDMPKMLKPFDWEECKAYFSRVVPSLARGFLGRGGQ